MYLLIPFYFRITIGRSSEQDAQEMKPKHSCLRGELFVPSAVDNSLCRRISINFCVLQKFKLDERHATTWAPVSLLCSTATSEASRLRWA